MNIEKELFELDDLKQMQSVIEEDCGKIDTDEW